VKAVPGRIAATADEASEYTKELLGNAVNKVRKAFIGQKEEAPDFLQDNEYIKSGYRIEHNSCCLAAKSLFTCHNESVNVWSHLIGALLFTVFLIGLGISIIPKRFEVGRELLKEYQGPDLQSFLTTQITDLKAMTDQLADAPVSSTTDQQEWQVLRDKTFKTNQGITYFGLSTLFSFDYIKEQDVKLAIDDWQLTIDDFCDELIQN
jgi:hypothetical protein